MSIFYPLITFLKFQIHFQKHLIECQHQNHDKNCQATCVLNDMMAEPKEEVIVPNHQIIIFFSILFCHESQFAYAPSTFRQLKVKHISGFLKFYSSPFLGKLTPPPRFY